jgi:ABC-type sugar transport system ATPase subunit
MEFLEVQSVSKTQGQQKVLDRVHFTLPVHQRLAIAGETGSGKTTLLKMIGGLVQPEEGQVIFEGQRIEGPEEKLLPGHPAIAFLSQHFELRNNYRVEELLGYANKKSDEEAFQLFRLCEIDHLLKRKTDQLSGGEKQRIALARLLVGTPRLLLLDEPFSNLDMIHKRTMKKVIENISRELGLTTILVSHDAGDLLSWSEQLILMQQGRIIQQGPPEEVYQASGKQLRCRTDWFLFFAF